MMRADMQCSERVQDGGSVMSRGCRRPVAGEHEGAPFCAFHMPAAVAARAAQSKVREKAMGRVWRVDTAIQDARRRILEVVADSDVGGAPLLTFVGAIRLELGTLRAEREEAIRALRELRP